MINRNIISEIKIALKDTPVILIHGARQTGKSTLAKQLISDHYKADYITLDDTAVLGSALSDPMGFVSGFSGNVIIDEVQKAPEIFSAIKLVVDKNRKPGKFILTGSANIFLLPRLSESLAGRVQVFTLYPFTKGEILKTKESFIDYLFSNQKIKHYTLSNKKNDILGSIVQGGFPEILKRKNIHRRREWFNAYVNTILQRDVKDISNIEGLTEMPRLLALLAARTSSLFNISELSRSLSIPQTTLKRYLNYINAVYLTGIIPAYSSNLGKRLIKSPRIVFIDTGLSSYLNSIHDTVSLRKSNIKGQLMENFVIMELLKQSSWSNSKPGIYHYRTLKGIETDIILESKNKIIGIEVKSSSSVSVNDFKGLKYLSSEFKNKFHRGIVLYNGQQSIPFGKNLHALPVASLWDINKDT